MYVNLYYYTLLIVFMTTVDYRLFDTSSGIPSITLTEIVAYSMLFLYLGQSAFGRFKLEEDVTLHYRKNKIIFIYFGWALLASICSLFFRSSSDAMQMFKNLLPSFIVYFFVVKFIVTPQRIISLILTYLAGISVNLLLCLSQIFLNGPRPMKVDVAVATKLDFSGQVASRLATGFFNHPNGLALLLLPAILLVLSVVVFRLFPGVLLNLFILLSLFCLVFTLRYTYAKGVYAWAIIGCVLLFIPQRMNRWRCSIGVCTLLAGITGITLYSLSTLLKGGANSLSTIVTRIYLWLAALEVIRADHFVQIFGDGFKAMLVASSDIANWEYPNAHNGIINQILFYGIPAFICYLWIFFAAIRRLSRLQFASDREMKVVASFLFSALIALFGEYFFEPSNVGVTLQTHFFIFIAVTTNLYYIYFDLERPIANERVTA